MSNASKIIRLKEVLKLTGLSKSRLYEAINNNQFPKPKKLFPNGRAVGFDSHAVQKWINEVLEVA